MNTDEIRRNARGRHVAVSAVVVLLAIAVVVPVVLGDRLARASGTVVAKRSRDGTRIASTRFGYSVVIPQGWTYDEHTDTSQGGPVLFSARSEGGSMPPPADCAGWASRSGVFVQLLEFAYQQPGTIDTESNPPDAPARQAITRERPARFGPEYGHDWNGLTPPCVISISFNDHDRGFVASVNTGGSASPAAVDRAFRVLDSLRLKRRSVSAFCAAALTNGTTLITPAQRRAIGRAAPTPQLEQAVEHPEEPGNVALIQSYLQDVCIGAVEALNA